jgi:hypothetical protein
VRGGTAPKQAGREPCQLQRLVGQPATIAGRCRRWEPDHSRHERDGRRVDLRVGAAPRNRAPQNSSTASARRHAARPAPTPWPPHGRLTIIGTLASGATARERSGGEPRCTRRHAATMACARTSALTVTWGSATRAAGPVTEAVGEGTWKRKNCGAVTGRRRQEEELSLHPLRSAQRRR